MRDDRRGQKPAAARAGRGRRANVGKHGQEKEEARQDIPPLRRPRDRLDAQWMHREEQGRRDGAPADGARRDGFAGGDERRATA